MALWKTNDQPRKRGAKVFSGGVAALIPHPRLAAKRSSTPAPKVFLPFLAPLRRQRSLAKYEANCSPGFSQDVSVLR